MTLKRPSRPPAGARARRRVPARPARPRPPARAVRPLGVARTLRDVGQRIRAVRLARRITLAHVARETGLSAGMLSMVERGVVNPSIGTLVAIADALKIPMAALFDAQSEPSGSPVVRREEQPLVRTRPGVERRVLARDEPWDVELAENCYAPGTASADHPIKHRGRELGVVLEGRLRVEVAGRTYELRPMDAIAFDSSLPHRFVNPGPRHARTIWVNVHGTRPR